MVRTENHLLMMFTCHKSIKVSNDHPKHFVNGFVAEAGDEFMGKIPDKQRQRILEIQGEVDPTKR